MKNRKAGCDQREYKSKQDTDSIDAQHHQCRLIRKKGRGEQYIYRQSGTAGHKGHQQGCQTLLLLVIQRAGRIDGRHIAAKAQHEGNKALSAEMEGIHQPVQQKGDACHIAAFLQ